jgi:hypothetical protein
MFNTLAQKSKVVVKYKPWTTGTPWAPVPPIARTLCAWKADMSLICTLRNWKYFWSSSVLRGWVPALKSSLRQSLRTDFQTFYNKCWIIVDSDDLGKNSNHWNGQISPSLLIERSLSNHKIEHACSSWTYSVDLRNITSSTVSLLTCPVATSNHSR